MKKIVGLMLVMVLAVGLLIGCSANYSEYENMAIKAVEELKKALVNPASLELNEVLVADVSNSESNQDLLYSYTFRIDYSAQNGVGGYNRNIVYINTNEAEDKGLKINILANSENVSETVSEDNILGHTLYNTIDKVWQDKWSSSCEKIDEKKIMDAINE